MMYYQTLLPSMSSGAGFDTHYYVSLIRGRGLLFADQQLMATQKTAALVKAYASDDGSAFRREFARAMVKMSSLGGVSNYQVPTRVTCCMLAQESDY
ncbi:hypothetical protein IFM89_005551 [Coptis chinensis]|uniref:Plant heme peroxidase family profile domain-containing protein n=1 Tax=Coptis chinensis TaxID=261450 RepID=A0A835H3T5_9MAGN|nr:hypothetical protein IFM89_005551 [Coptis chinensis]